MKSLFKLFFILVLFMTDLTAQSEANTSEEIICPCMVEYEFPGDPSDFFYQLTGGVPVLRLSNVKIKDDNTLVCVYEREFAGGNLTIEHKGFSFWGDDCADAPLYLTMSPKNLERFAPGWCMNKDVRLQKTYTGYIAYDIECTDMALNTSCWHGVTYKRKMTDDSDPNLYKIFEGFAKVNEQNTGFIVSTTIAGLSDGDGEIMHAPAPGLQQNKKITTPTKIKKPVKKIIK